MEKHRSRGLLGLFSRRTSVAAPASGSTNEQNCREGIGHSLSSESNNSDGSLTFERVKEQRDIVLKELQITKINLEAERKISHDLNQRLIMKSISNDCQLTEKEDQLREMKKEIQNCKKRNVDLESLHKVLTLENQTLMKRTAALARRDQIQKATIMSSIIKLMSTIEAFQDRFISLADAVVVSNEHQTAGEVSMKDICAKTNANDHGEEESTMPLTECSSSDAQQDTVSATHSETSHEAIEISLCKTSSSEESVDEITRTRSSSLSEDALDAISEVESTSSVTTFEEDQMPGTERQKASKGTELSNEEKERREREEIAIQEKIRQQEEKFKAKEEECRKLQEEHYVIEEELKEKYKAKKEKCRKLQEQYNAIEDVCRKLQKECNAIEEELRAEEEKSRAKQEKWLAERMDLFKCIDKLKSNNEEMKKKFIQTLKKHQWKWHKEREKRKKQMGDLEVKYEETEAELMMAKTALADIVEKGMNHPALQDELKIFDTLTTERDTMSIASSNSSLTLTYSLTETCNNLSTESKSNQEVNIFEPVDNGNYAILPAAQYVGTENTPPKNNSAKVHSPSAPSIQCLVEEESPTKSNNITVDVLNDISPKEQNKTNAY